VDLLPGGKQLGGAPANFAYHAHELGAEALVVSRVGVDPLGHEILDRLRALGLTIDCVGVDTKAPTGTVSVEISPTASRALPFTKTSRGTASRPTMRRRSTQSALEAWRSANSRRAAASESSSPLRLETRCACSTSTPPAISSHRNLSKPRSSWPTC